MKGKDLKDYWEGDLGVSYIPWSKVKPDIDIELLEDGGMIDEDTMPAWMKAKVAEISSKPAPQVSVDKADSKDSSSVDTSHPPPVPGAGLLQPPLTLPLVNPFQLNSGLLGMNLPPGMMPNVPIGVPPPNLPPAPMMNNPLLGMGSPFGQAPPPSLLQMSLPSLPSADKSQTPVSEAKLPTLAESIMSLSQTFGLAAHPHMLSASQDDNMDVEMEDAEKSDRPSALSDQLLASLNQYGNNNNSNLAMAVNRLHAAGNDRPNPGGLGSDPPHDVDERRDRREDRDRGRRNSRSRDRDREHNRDRSRRDSRDHNRDNRGDRRDDRRDRNRWNDRDRREERERRERSEKTVNDRLWEMAEGYSSRDRPRDRIEDNCPDPPLMDRPMFPMHDGPVGMIEPEMEERFRRDGPPPGKFY